MSKILIGWAEESLVPSKRVSLDGQFFERISEYVESEISATAMAVEADGDCMIMVSCDLPSIADYVLDLTREKFAKICPQVNPLKIILAATHTHTSHTLGKPDVDNSTFAAIKELLNEYLPEENQYEELVSPNEDVISPAEATEFVTDRIALAAKKAWENRAEAYYTNEFGRAAVGMCRRVQYDDGSSQMWGDVNTANFVALEGGNDSGIELIYTF